MNQTRFRRAIKAFCSLVLLSVVGCRADSIASSDKENKPLAAPNKANAIFAWSEAIYDSISVQGDVPDADLVTPSCPHFDGIKRTLKLGVLMGDGQVTRIASFTFEGYKPFISYESRGTRPIAYFGPVPETLSDNDAAYVAWGRLRIRCVGGYMRAPGIRIWTGQLTTLGVDFTTESGLGGGGGGPTPCDPTQLQYDPYDEDQEEDCSGGGEGGTPPPGSGTQYEPGDNTGGETVDWNTGVGNGGSSACGAEAVVEYICIDVYNEGTGQWETWSCGYATGC